MKTSTSKTLNTQQKIEDTTVKGNRTDNRDLTQEWHGSYVWNKAQFEGLNQNSGRVLGLFNSSHMEYEHERVREHGSASLADEPNLIDMTTKAIELLEKNQNGYILVVEAARVDHAAHDANAYRMLTENVVFSETKELGRVNQVDPLGITNLRIRGMWQIENPRKVFKYLHEPTGKEFELVCIIPKEKYHHNLMLGSLLNRSSSF